LRGHDETRHASTLRDYMQMVHRRKWIILQAVVIVPLVAFFYSARQPKIYEASAQVLLSQQQLANSLTGVPDTSSVYQTADQVAATQAALARVPSVANRAAASSGIPGRSGGALLASSSVTPQANSNILEFNVRDRSPRVAAALATAYAHAFTVYRQQLDTSALNRARVDLEQRMEQLKALGGGASSLYTSLAQKDELLRTMEALQTSNANVIRDAGYGYKVGPHPSRDGLLGLLVGIVLGIGLAFLRETLDTRVRTAEEIHDRLDLPLLARLPQPPRPLRKADELVMVRAPDSPQAEAFRMLRTNLEFVRLDHAIRSVMVTSALEGEGKSTTAANLAIACARFGQRVILVDLDLHRPYLERFFAVNERPGLTQVVLGQASLDKALAPIPLLAPRKRTSHGSHRVRVAANGNGQTQSEGMLEVLLAGPIPPDIDGFVGTPSLANLLGELRQRADLVIIDSPPLLVVGDAMALTSVVDGLLVVTRTKIVRRPVLKELRRVLDSSPAQKLGFVLTGATVEDGYYGYDAYRYRYRAPEREEARRAPVRR
jgi:succinoglycan biosynthesis transport protein ExoP